MPGSRVVIVGAGFAGYHTARGLTRHRRLRDEAEIVLVNPTDYFLYLPLLPQVAAGVLDPRRVSVSLPGTLPGARLVLGEVDHIDLDRRTVSYAGPEGDRGNLGYDRLVLTVGSVNKLLPVPGVAEHAHGFRGIPEALYLRDHITRQIELAGAAEDPAERAARCTFVVVGAGYTGTEVAAHGQLFTDALVRRHRDLRRLPRPRWMLLDIADRVLPELDRRLSRTAERVLRRRGVDVRTGHSVREATAGGVVLDTGEAVPTRSLVWCVGVRPDPLVAAVGLPEHRGRLVVGPDLVVPGRPEVYAAGDAAAVPDLTRPGSYTPMTAQHAQRQGRTAARNIAASYGYGEPAPYRHRDLGFTVDLGGAQAAANPLGVHLSGPVAGLVTRGYHLISMPGNRVRVAADWLLGAVLPRQGVQLGLVRSWAVPLDTAAPELPRTPAGALPGRDGKGRSGEGHGGKGTDGAGHASGGRAAPDGPGQNGAAHGAGQNGAGHDAGRNGGGPRPDRRGAGGADQTRDTRANGETAHEPHRHPRTRTERHPDQ